MARLVFTFLMLVLSPTAHAQSIEGRWLFTAGDVPLMELTVDGERGDRRATLLRPQEMALSANSVESAAGPFIAFTGGPGESMDGGVLITLSAENEGDRTFLLTPLSDEVVELSIPGAPIPGLLFNRIDEPASLALFEGDPLPIVRAYPSNAEMTAIFEVDQRMRENIPASEEGRNAIGEQDRLHRIRTRELLDAGQLRSAEDFYHAAFIFQHGGESESYLLAHILATTALKLGYEGAEWIAAASLDRYLQSTGQRQVFGTQYREVETDQGTRNSRGDYDKELLTDAIRMHHGVPPLDFQEEQLRLMNDNGG